MGVLVDLAGGGVHMVPSLFCVDLHVHFSMFDNWIVHLELGVAIHCVV